MVSGNVDHVSHFSFVMPYAPTRPALGRTIAEAITFLRPSSTLRVDHTLPRGAREPVLILPVIGRGDGHSAPMRAALDELGSRTFGWEGGINVGPTPQILAAIERRLLSLYSEHGPLHIVGFSLGGVFARLLAHSHADKVQQVVTVCSPFRETVDSAFVPLRPMLPLWRTPGLIGIAARAAQPLPVPGTFIFSRNDGIVAWRSCIEPTQPDDCFEIPGPHVTITRDADVLAILSRRLAARPVRSDSG